MKTSQTLKAQCCIYIFVFFIHQGPIAPPSLFDPPSAPSAPCPPPPPPPPPGPPPVFTDDDSQPQADGAGAQHSALFAQLNQGMDITKGEFSVGAFQHDESVHMYQPSSESES